MPYLLVAEADKIQSFIFESSKLRQVVGASAMLVNFDENVRKNPDKYLGTAGLKQGENADYKIISAGGGNFRIWFREKSDADNALKALRVKFAEEVGANMTLTVTEVPAVESEQLEAGNDALRKAKTGGRVPTALWHLPYHALCQSSGTRLANTYDSETNFADDNADKKYLSNITLKKDELEVKGNTVLNQMRSYYNGIVKKDNPDAIVRFPHNATEPDTYAWDSRNYIAYLQADGYNPLAGHYFCDDAPHFVIGIFIDMIFRVSNCLDVAFSVSDASKP